MGPALDRKRPLWIVYDEAHNTTTEQVELLDDLTCIMQRREVCASVGGALR